ncbi:MAG TPA: aspartate dehydrogenase [Candidatus Hydrothermia bacterium]|nr:aspartate dehydrogenase [Candidatus Hydrothermae bacterium]MDD3648973.1 aspartate dehydrogenase [Candidatus Hydrothermia bacterium]MDD5573112.1 aspartate dehydrogenase [Candidatus Hydrothermia bacterium]HOK23214.1 aspartate dehydrogenase [Candidatus Hydrothermia bacterium]HOL23918.1 aspartate dehydrogenase [Candidatus Hydrothermia bacterium]
MRLGIIGCGAIGTFIAGKVDGGDVENIVLNSIYDVKVEKAYMLYSSLSRKPFVASDFSEFMKSDIDIVLEAASQEALKSYAFSIFDAEKDLVVMSAGALADDAFRESLFKYVKDKRRMLYIPSGAIAGLDALKALSNVKIKSARLVTRKPPSGLGSKSPEPEVLFRGSASDAAKLFPQNINVAIALGLAGDMLDKLEVVIIADPKVKSNEHKIEVKSEAGDLRIALKNLPFPENPRTSFLAALSCLEVLRSLGKNIVIGS